MITVALAWVEMLDKSLPRLDTSATYKKGDALYLLWESCHRRGNWFGLLRQAASSPQLQATPGKEATKMSPFEVV